VFSFTPHKIITTGQGGAIVTDNKEIYEKVSGLKDFCRVGPGQDVHKAIGFNFKFTDIQAVIGLEQLKLIDFASVDDARYTSCIGTNWKALNFWNSSIWTSEMLFLGLSR